MPPRSKKSARSKRAEDFSPSSSPAALVFPDTLPVIYSKDLVAFPSVMVRLFIDKQNLIKSLKAATEGDKLIFLVAQQNDQTDSPKPSDLYQMGTIVHIVRTMLLPDGGCRVLVQGLARAKVIKYSEKKGVLRAELDPLLPEEATKVAKPTLNLMTKIKKTLDELVSLEEIPEEVAVHLEELHDPGQLADVILAHLRVEPQKLQEGLQELDANARLKLTMDSISGMLSRSVISEQIREKARDELEKGQREYYLREQMHQIQVELGEEDTDPGDLATLKREIEKAKLPKSINSEVLKQYVRLQRLSPESGDAAMLRTYLEWIIALPWNNRTKDILDLKRAKKILEEDHHGLQKVKDRIIEYLSVRKLKKDPRGPILCLVGPPGVGKTSLGRSIAKALDRQFVRLSLGGVRDEAEIRGHRRTYVGSLPGRIIQGLKNAGSKNPVFVLDELDKIGADFRGDPASALLEVLDPQQNKDFMDHYLDLPFDLSEVLFFATANTTDTIPEALQDRLEVISIPGYTTEEKLIIAERFLVPRQLQECGLNKENLFFAPGALLRIIEGYTREAGVRNLEREIGALCRKVARNVAEGRKLKHIITPKVVEKLLGITKYESDSSKIEDAVGRVTGLAWTVAGGETMEIEVSSAKGGGELHLTGQLGEVMQESAKAAFFFSRANAESLGLDPGFHQKLDFHIHVPEGSTPKDGPSAGIAIVAAIVSVLTGRKVSKDYAMTGEVTLRGRVLIIGGLKEKALAALRQGINKIIIPADNLKDLDDIPAESRKQLQFIPVRHVSEVLKFVLLPEKKIKPNNKRKN